MLNFNTTGYAVSYQINERNFVLSSIDMANVSCRKSLYLKGVKKKDSNKVKWKSSNKRIGSTTKYYNYKKKRYECMVETARTGKTGKTTITATYNGRKYTTKARFVEPA